MITWDMSIRTCAVVAPPMCNSGVERYELSECECGCEVEPLWFNTPAKRLIPGPFRGPNVPPNRKLEFPIFNDCARRLASRWISLRKIVNPLGGSANVRLPARK